MSFGSFGQLEANWNALVAFQGGRIWTWLGNSVFYAGAALVLTLIVSIPGRLRARQDRLQVSPRHPHLDPHGDAHPEHGTRAADLPRNQRGAPRRDAVGGHPPIRVLPIRRLPRVSSTSPRAFRARSSTPPASMARASSWSSGRIAMPLALPVVALVGFFNFVTNWNNYFLPFVMFPGSKTMPIQVGLVELLANVQQFNPTTVASIVSRFPSWRSRRSSPLHRC